LEGWRATGIGVWAWLLQRITAVVLLAAVVFHLRNPFVRSVQALLLSLLLLHGALGIRAMILDLGLPVRLHGVLFIASLLLAITLFLMFWWWRWY
jgi:succinate dehydrogenase hydrophobic anchor subunit